MSPIIRCISGAVIALVWANIAPDSYYALVHFTLWSGGPVWELPGISSDRNRE